MKKVIVTLFAVMVASVASLSAQNLQLHYDFGRHIYDAEDGRQVATITSELFKADGLGSWYYFIDLDLDKQGTVSAYTEISREFNLMKGGPWAAHVEFNGGLNTFGAFQPAALAGVAYNGHNDDFSFTWSVQALYKQFFSGAGAYSSAQLTGVWGYTFAEGKWAFSGFIDFWRGQKGDGHGQLVILTEPQIWYNINKNISIGGEVEISNNFIFNVVDDKSFFVNPTLALKYNF